MKNLVISHFYQLALRDNPSLATNKMFFDAFTSAKIFLFGDDHAPFSKAYAPQGSEEVLVGGNGTDKEIQAHVVPVKDILEGKEALSLPFQTCYFEMANPDAPLLMFVDTDTNQRGSSIAALLVHEIAPYHYMAHSVWFRDGKFWTEAIIVGNRKVREAYGNSRRSLERIKAMEHCIDGICEFIHNSSLGEEKVFTSIKLKDTPVGKYSMTVNSIIRLSPKNQSENVRPLFAREIDWTHRWWVRGHWRRLEGGIGKDRFGNYSVSGFTWVTEHIKGPDDKDIAEKIYLT